MNETALASDTLQLQRSATTTRLHNWKRIFSHELPSNKRQACLKEGGNVPNFSPTDLETQDLYCQLYD